MSPLLLLNVSVKKRLRNPNLGHRISHKFLPTARSALKNALKNPGEEIGMDTVCSTVFFCLPLVKSYIILRGQCPSMRGLKSVG